MTLSPAPAADPATLADLYAMMGVETLLAHFKASAAAIAAAGVELTASARCAVDEVEECVVEHFARHDPLALRRHLAQVAVESGEEPSPAIVAQLAGAL